MSLVHDALQKAAREKSRKIEPSAVPIAEKIPAKTAAETAPPPSLSPKSLKLLPVLSIAVAIFALILGIFALKNREFSTLETPKIVTPNTETPKTSAEIPAKPVEIAAPPQFRLTGIMADPQGVYCAVINGAIVYPDQKISGATVKEIRRDAVVLETAEGLKELQLTP
jgi:hypothetical protein